LMFSIIPPHAYHDHQETGVKCVSTKRNNLGYSKSEV
jgi:hypothetical protein